MGKGNLLLGLRVRTCPRFSASGW